ncbi:unnamed protein product [Musa acuminata subsp. burmannicoides]
MLQDLNVDVSIANISERSMMAPNYDTRSTKLAMVVEGRGYIEMACPHRSAERRRTQEEKGSQGEQRVRYRTVRSRVSRGSVFVIPAGHPAAVVAAANENLQVLCFGTRSENNRGTTSREEQRAEQTRQGGEGDGLRRPGGGSGRGAQCAAGERVHARSGAPAGRRREVAAAYLQICRVVSELLSLWVGNPV